MSSIRNRANACSALSPPARRWAASSDQYDRGIGQIVGPAYLLLGSALLLEVAVFSVRRLARLSNALHRRPGTAAGGTDEVIGGTAFSGLTHAFKSPYLINVSLYILLYAVTSTFLYFQQAEIAKQAFSDRGARTAFFAQIDLWVNILTLGAQLFVTSRVIRALGVGFTLASLPALSILGFMALATAPTLAIIVGYQVLRRAGNFAFARPSREVLFTVVPRDEKYKAKSFIDTVVYRTGDQAGAWTYAGLGLLGMSMTGIAIFAVPLSLLWLLNGLWLGRKQEALANGTHVFQSFKPVKPFKPSPNFKAKRERILARGLAGISQRLERLELFERLEQAEGSAGIAMAKLQLYAGDDGAYRRSTLLMTGCAAYQIAGQVQSGRQALLTNNPEAVLGYFQQAASENPQYVYTSALFSEGVLTYLGLGTQYLTGKLPEARESLERALNFNRNDHMARLYLGLTLARTGEAERGIRRSPQRSQDSTIGLITPRSTGLPLAIGIHPARFAMRLTTICNRFQGKTFRWKRSLPTANGSGAKSKKRSSECCAKSSVTSGTAIAFVGACPSVRVSVSNVIYITINRGVVVERFLGGFSDQAYALMRIVIGHCFFATAGKKSSAGSAASTAKARRRN